MLRMQEMGLIGVWLDRYQHKPKQCFNMDKERKKEELRNPPQFNLKNVVGTFAVFGIGLGLAFLVFVLEKFWSWLAEAK